MSIAIAAGKADGFVSVAAMEKFTKATPKSHLIDCRTGVDSVIAGPLSTPVR